MKNNKNEWEEVNETAKELRGAMGLVFGFLFWGVMIMIGIWAFLETIFQITLTPVEALLIFVGIVVIYVVKLWLSNRHL